MTFARMSQRSNSGLVPTFWRKLSSRRWLSSCARSCTRPSVAVVFFFVFCISLRNTILITLSVRRLADWIVAVRCTFKSSSNTLKNKGHNLKGAEKGSLMMIEVLKVKVELSKCKCSMIKTLKILEFINVENVGYRFSITGKILWICITSFACTSSQLV